MADADIDVPLTLGQEMLDGGDTTAGEPKDGKNDKVPLQVAETRSEIRKVVWACGLTDGSRPFFAGRDHVLPQKNAPPGFFL